ncbi:MAG: hypothetical protein ACLTSX_07515 [Collinsella sp.]
MNGCEYEKRGAAIMAILLGCDSVHLEFPHQADREGRHPGRQRGRPHRHRRQERRRQVDACSSVLAGSLVARRGRVTRRRDVTVGRAGPARCARQTPRTVHTRRGGRHPRVRVGLEPARPPDPGRASSRDVPWEGLVGELSGGQRRRVDLARLLIGDYDVPHARRAHQPSGHAHHQLARRRISSRRWRPGPARLLVVTHDRWFLDEVCTSMWEVHDGCVDPFEGGYPPTSCSAWSATAWLPCTEERRRNTGAQGALHGSRARRPGAQHQAQVPRRGRARAHRRRPARAQRARAQAPGGEPPGQAGHRCDRRGCGYARSDAGGVADDATRLARRAGSAAISDGATVRARDPPPPRSTSPRPRTVVSDVTWLIGAATATACSARTVPEDHACSTSSRAQSSALARPREDRLHGSLRRAVPAARRARARRMDETIREVLARGKALRDGRGQGDERPRSSCERLGFTQPADVEPHQDLSGGQSAACRCCSPSWTSRTC